MAEDVKQEAQETPNFSGFWQQQAADASSGGNTFFFPKAERSRFRLMGIGNDPNEWFRKVQSVYQGKTSDKYLVMGYEITDPNNQSEFMLQCIVMPKSVWAAVCNMMAEEYDLFGKDKGLALVITRSNQSGRISYTSMASPKIVPANDEMWKEASAKTWAHFITEYDKMQEGRGQSTEGNGGNDSLADQIVNQPGSTTDW